MKILILLSLFLTGCSHRLIVKDCDRVQNDKGEWVCTYEDFK